MSLTAYIRYDHNNRIVPGGPIFSREKPAVGNWQVVTEGTNVTLSGKLRAFVKLDRYNKPLAGSLFLGKERPATGKWIEVNATYTGAAAPITTTTTTTTTTFVPSTTTTTTTTSSSTTTTTTTQAQPHPFNLDYIPRYGDNGSFACSQYGQGAIGTFYSNVTTLVPGSILYTDYQMNSPWSGAGPDAWFAVDNNGTLSAVQVGSIPYGNTGVVLSIIPCSQLTTTTTTTTIAGYTVGQQALGGVIAYILQSFDPGYDPFVQHGLVVSIPDVSTGAEWGCAGTSISTGFEVGTGNQNTVNIIAGCPTPGIAARLCADLVEGGYSDWYLPSQEELSRIYTNRAIIGVFANAQYWNSTEGGAEFAGSMDFSGTGGYGTNKVNSYHVKAVRSF